jgi:hypothetical protein
VEKRRARRRRRRGEVTREGGEGVEKENGNTKNEPHT